MEEAIEAYEHAIALFLATKRFVQAAEASHTLGQIHLWRADPTRACAVVDRAVQAAGTQALPARYQLHLLECGQSRRKR